MIKNLCPYDVIGRLIFWNCQMGTIFAAGNANFQTGKLLFNNCCKARGQNFCELAINTTDWGVQLRAGREFRVLQGGRAPYRVVRVTSSSEPSVASASGAFAASSTAGLIPITLKPALDKRDSEALKVALNLTSPFYEARSTKLSLYSSLPSARLTLNFSWLEQDWGFFVPYLVGGLSIVVLAVGSVAPGYALLSHALTLLLQGGIGAMAPVFSDYKDRVLRHEAGHFLLAYLLGLPPVAYSLDIGKEHTNLLDDKLQKKIYSGKLEGDDVDRLAVVAMAGMAAEGLQYEQVMGQTADLNSLQRLINRSGLGAMTPERQQNLTRWAVLYAASLIKNNSNSFDALMQAMAREAPVEECIAAIENAAAK
ncbi:unnamed protein product [Closterium sp. NIES-54]